MTYLCYPFPRTSGKNENEKIDGTIFVTLGTVYSI